MIDKENEVFTRVKRAVMAKYSGLTDKNFASAYTNSTTIFPFISIIQQDSSDDLGMADNTNIERGVNISFDVNVYSNKANTKKSECKKIISIVDDTMRSMNFMRETLRPTPNMVDSSIYRITGRYSAKADANNFYRR